MVLKLVATQCETEAESPSSTTPRLYVSCLSAVFVFVALVLADMARCRSVDGDLQCTKYLTCSDLPGGTRLFPAIS
jgi:hypothetical protein